MYNNTRTFICALALLLAPSLLAAATPSPAVSSAHPLATQAGSEVLEAGGNAFDAAVAMAAVLAVVEPQESGLGGGGFFLMHRAAGGKDLVVDARETAPDAATGDMYLDANAKPVPHFSRDSPLGSAIPGTPAALAHISERMGSRSLADNLAPAIELARKGFAVDAKLVGAIRATAGRLSPAARAVFMPGGRVLQPGEKLVQRDLARTLQALAAHGARGFYDGEVAARLRQGVFNDGGIWRRDDLRRYRVAEREPARIAYRGHRVTTVPLPGAGGVTLAQMLGALEARDWPPSDDATAWHELIEIMRLAHRDMAVHLGDPAFVDVPADRLTSPSYVAQMADSVGRMAGTVPRTDVALLQQREKGRNTTHFSVIDAAGNRVSATLSINSLFGSGYMPPGTGVVLNNQMDDFATAPLARDVSGRLHARANHVQPHKRPLSTMTPIFVEGPRGVFITGTPGGSRTLNMTLLAVLLHVNGLDVDQIVAAPRLHHQYLPNVVEIEANTLSGPQMQSLKQRGHVLRPQREAFGDMQAIHWDTERGVVEAASDPRGRGAARVLSAH
jgi:gamma-glutamyltranspeptidase/glutathione hydrolase